MRERYLGLELSGAKNSKTAISVLEYYPREKKIFLLDIHDKISGNEGLSSAEPVVCTPGFPSADSALVALLKELSAEASRMGVNVPLTLPPCFTGKKAEAAAIDWMIRFSKKAARDQSKKRIEFTPYTQRPVELYIRHHVLDDLPRSLQFEVDEALGGNRAPLTARMQFLLRHTERPKWVEASPKLTALRLCLKLGMERRILTRYRKLEEGAHARMEFLEHLSAKHDIFIYDRDLRKLSNSLTAFDSFLCAYTALLSHQGDCEKPPRGFPKTSGWIEYPRSE